MKEYLEQMTAGEYYLFRAKVLEQCHLTRQQFSDRKTGRVKLTALEHEIIKGIVAELPSHQKQKAIAV